MIGSYEIKTDTESNQIITFCKTLHKDRPVRNISKDNEGRYLFSECNL